MGPCPAGYCPTFHIDRNCPGLSMQRCLLRSGYDHMAAFSDGSGLRLQLWGQVRDEPLTPGGVCRVKLIIDADNVFCEYQMPRCKVFADGGGAAPTHQSGHFSLNQSVDGCICCVGTCSRNRQPVPAGKFMQALKS